MIRIESETVVEGQACRKYHVYDQPVGEFINILSEVGYTFERNDSVFFWMEDQFLLRYDFSASPSDTVTIPLNGLFLDSLEPEMIRVVLDSITMVEVGTEQTLLEKYHTSKIDGSYNYWDNGYFRVIGNRRDFRGLIYDGIGIVIGTIPVYRVRCYIDGDYELYLTDINCNFPTSIQTLLPEDQLTISPNPTSSIIHLKYDEALSGAVCKLN